MKVYYNRYGDQECNVVAIELIGKRIRFHIHYLKRSDYVFNVSLSELRKYNHKIKKLIRGYKNIGLNIVDGRLNKVNYSCELNYDGQGGYAGAVDVDYEYLDTIVIKSPISITKDTITLYRFSKSINIKDGSINYFKTNFKILDEI